MTEIDQTSLLQPNFMLLRIARPKDCHRLVLQNATAGNPCGLATAAG